MLDRHIWTKTENRKEQSMNRRESGEGCGGGSRAYQTPYEIETLLQQKYAIKIY